MLSAYLFYICPWRRISWTQSALGWINSAISSGPLGFPPHKIKVPPADHSTYIMGFMSHTGNLNTSVVLLYLLSESSHSQVSTTLQHSLPQVGKGHLWSTSKAIHCPWFRPHRAVFCFCKKKKKSTAFCSRLNRQNPSPVSPMNSPWFPQTFPFLSQVPLQMPANLPGPLAHLRFPPRCFVPSPSSF